MNKSSVTTLLLIGGAAGIYYLLKDKIGTAAPDDKDMMMLAQLQQMQIADQLQEQELMKIIARAKQSGDSQEAMNPWTHPNTVFQAAKIGIDIVGLFA